MGDSKGHITNGTAFCILAIWHFFNLLKLQQVQSKSNSRTSLPVWFPSSPIRYLELLFIMVASSISFYMEVFTGSHHHGPLAADGSFLSEHIPHLEHAVFALAIFVYAFAALLLDKIPNPSNHAFTNSLAAVAFAVELFTFHLHSTDHIGLEGRYHWLFQIVIFTTLATTLLGIGSGESFVIGYLRSISLLFQGVWLINTGFMLWTPWLIPKGCFMNKEKKNGHSAVRCHTVEALNRAKGLATLQFSYCALIIVSLTLATYLVFVKARGLNGQDQSSAEGCDEVDAEQKCRLVGQ
ncbi:uncharacterized protein LOC127259457 [Andrographis paniculata]|uniref:uncharacterized protein LOC127259457 n=1 Tax=Andrographis paniculata TaxID=175694 RepID=UPI0021E6F678|nr:uncharacterized protein LOC127259457 [Andrographis paniculata]